MEIQKDCVVNFYYEISEDGGPELEGNRDRIPLAFLHSHGNILAGLEEAMTGKSTGEKIQITLPPEKAYGPRKNNATQKVPIKHLASKHKRLMPGTLVKLNTENGVVDASVIKAGKFMVELDLNHPFAGKTLTFDIEIASVRDATQEELAHGHAHGDGGHHH